MGCSPSRIDDSVVVTRCKKRKRVIKQAVSYRQDFAIAHMAYIQSLKSIGVTFRRFAGADDSAIEDPSSPSSSVPVLSWQQPSSPSASPLPSTSVAPGSSPPPTSVPEGEHAHSSPPHQPPSPSPPPPSSPPPIASASPASSSPPPPTSSQSSPPALNSPRLPSASPSPSRTSYMSPTYLESTFFSPDRSPMSSPPYSPPKAQENNYFMPFSASASVDPPPPPSPPRNYAWDYFDFFNPALPFHSLDQRKAVQEEESQDLEQVREEEGIPDLEDEDNEVGATEKKEVDNEEKEEVQVQEKPEQTAFQENVEEEPEKVVPEIYTEVESEKVEEIMEEEEVSQNAEKKAVPEEKKKVEEKKFEKELVALTSSSGKNLVDVVKLIDDQFIRAYSSGKDVAEMLETTKAHSHLSFFDFKDSIKIFNAITSHWSKKTPLVLKDSDGDSDMAECGMMGSHASTLERLLAWEKKLYDEVKAGELIRIAFDRKRQQLRSQDAKGEDSNVIDKTRAAVKKLDTRLMVALRAVHSVSISIQKLMDEELYPQLIEILGGLVNMWKVMLECHKIQKEISLELKNLENSAASEEISEAHRKATIELESQLYKWQKCFNHWIISQSSYIKSLYSWLTYCQLEPEQNTKGRAIASYQPEEPPLLLLVRNWHSALERMREHQEVVDAIDNFSVVIHALQVQQLEELRQRRRAESLSKDLEQKIHLLQKMEEKYTERPLDSDDNGLRSTVRNTIEEKRAALDDLKSRVDEEKENYKKFLEDRRKTTLSSLQKNLPSIFEALSTFAAIALEEYESLQQPKV